MEIINVMIVNVGINFQQDIVLIMDVEWMRKGEE